MRELVSLDGKWEYSYNLNFNEATDWKKINVPSNWYLEGIEASGKIVFRKKFKNISLKQHQRIFLCFKGVDYSAEVFLNNHYLGKHEGYFAPFKFEITRYLKDNNIVHVIVDSPFETPDKWPDNKELIKGIFNQHDTRPGGWDVKRGQEKNTGGIWNSVNLMITNKVRTRWLQVNSKILSETEALLMVTANIEKMGSDVSVRAKLSVEPENFEDDDYKTTVAYRQVSLAREKDPVVFCLTLKNPKLWWCKDYGFPHLYKIKLELFFENHKIDEFSQIVGIREIRIENWVWYLNNKRIFIRGVNYIPTQWLSEFNEKMLEKDLNLIENANINAIRVHGHINRKELYQECDKKGILVWQDFALQWSYSKADSFIAKAVVQIREMVWYLMSHPSIVVWCCHNEPSDNLKKLTPFLYHALKSTDTSRHIEMSSDLETHPYPGWYYGDYHEFSGLPCSPMITEFGAQALPNKESLMKFIPEKKMWPPDWKFWAYHDFRYEQTFNVAEIDLGNSIDEFIKNSQDYQAELLKYSIENYRRAKHNPTAGLFQFMFVDCWPSITWSVLDYYRKPKKGYEILKRAYQPVLVSLQVKRGPIIGSTINNDGTVQMFAFWDPRQAVWITNDLYKEFKNCILKIEIVNKSDKSYGEKKFKIDILPDSSKVVWHPKRFEKAIKFKKPLRAGKYFVKLTVYEKNKKILSRNYTEIRLMRSENSV